MKLTKRVLYNRAKPWVFVGCDFQTDKLAKQMLTLMRAQQGIGLAAPQIGISKRVFVMEIDQRQWQCFNPEILSKSEYLIEMSEGCLSFPGELCIIQRPAVIQVRYQDAMGQWYHEELEGIAARCFQHELDHLEGETMQDRYKEQHAE